MFDFCYLQYRKYRKAESRINLDYTRYEMAINEIYGGIVFTFLYRNYIQDKGLQSQSNIEWPSFSRKPCITYNDEKNLNGKREGFGKNVP